MLGHIPVFLSPLRMLYHFSLLNAAVGGTVKYHRMMERITTFSSTMVKLKSTLQMKCRNL